jgi:uncharacterized membrane protein
MNKLITRMVWLVALLPAIYIALVWKQVPDKVAMHFDINGDPDRYGNKSELALVTGILFVVSLGVYYLMANIHRIDPKRYAQDNTNRFRKIGFAVTVFMSALTCFIIYSSINGGSKMDTSLILAAVCLLLAVIGNYMPNLKPNYFAGMRLPWTLEDPDNWKATHALAGKIWFIGGILLGIVCFILPQKAAFAVFMSGVVAMVLIPAVYSWRFYVNKKKAG